MFCFRRKDTESGDAPESLRRLRLRFRGEVQGVGFRWTSRIIADKMGCTGWVRNDSDGTDQPMVWGSFLLIRPLSHRLPHRREGRDRTRLGRARLRGQVLLGQRPLNSFRPMAQDDPDANTPVPLARVLRSRPGRLSYHGPFPSLLGPPHASLNVLCQAALVYSLVDTRLASQRSMP